MADFWVLLRFGSTACLASSMVLLGSFGEASLKAAAAEITPEESFALEEKNPLPGASHRSEPISLSENSRVTRSENGDSRGVHLSSQMTSAVSAQVADSVSASLSATTPSKPAVAAEAPFPGNSATAAEALQAESNSRDRGVEANFSAPNPELAQTPSEPAPAPGASTPDTTTPSTAPPPAAEPSQPGTNLLQEVSPGRATRSGSSYFGLGGNIGIGSGDTALGEGSFAIISKIGLTRDFSVRPSLLIADDVTILLPLTYDFNFGTEPTTNFGFRAAPYIGIGPAISTGDGASVDLLLTGGLDIPLGSQFTLNAAVNATVTGEVAVGVLVGVGYNFQGF